jgi:hypothetical protein
MRRTLLAVLAVFVLNTEVAEAACRTDACRRVTAWKTGYTAVVLHDGVSQEAYLSVLREIREGGGAVAIEADEVLLGWVPGSRARSVAANRAVRAVLYGPAPHEAGQGKSPRSLDALRYYNRIHMPDFEDTIENGIAAAPSNALASCTANPGTPPKMPNNEDAATIEETSEPAKAAGFRRTVDSASSPRLRAASDSVIYSTANLEMKGRVSLQYFRMDSTGPASTYDWAPGEMQTAADAVYTAANWWSYEAQAQGILLSFALFPQDPFNRYIRSFVPTPTNYEPIDLPPDQINLWMNDALAYRGYGSSDPSYFNVLTQNEEFNLAALSGPGGPYDHSFTIYMVHNPPPATATYPGYDWAGFAPFLGGTSLIVLTHGLGMNNLWALVRHEIGHAFWACDEYYSGCSSCNHCQANRGPRTWVPNGNCERRPTLDSSETSCWPYLDSCIMRSHSASTTCLHTRQQIGW